jgi:hypothetical protein
MPAEDGQEAVFVRQDARGLVATISFSFWTICSTSARGSGASGCSPEQRADFARAFVHEPLSTVSTCW